MGLDYYSLLHTVFWIGRGVDEGDLQVMGVSQQYHVGEKPTMMILHLLLSVYNV